MHSHSHRQRLDHLLYYLSIMLGPMVALCRNVYRLVALDTTQPHILPLAWCGRGKRRGNKKNLVRNHPRSRGIGSTQLPETGLLSLGKPCLKLLSFYPWPGIARLLHRWRLNALWDPNPSRQAVNPLASVTQWRCLLCCFRFRFSTLFTLKL
jgi:hypothetical protein